MSIEVLFYDYKDDSGNRFKQWMDNIGVDPKSKINAKLRVLENVPIPQWHLYTKYIEKLKHQPDLWEIKAKADKTQWRPIGIVGPEGKTFTLLDGASKKDNKYNPPTVFNRAQQRKKNVIKDTAGHRTHHVYK